MRTYRRTCYVLCLVFSQSLCATLLQDRLDKANDTANSISHPTNAHSELRDPGFYWEIGDVNGPLSDPDNGTVDGDSDGQPDRTESMNIASASKWLYAAYFAERYGAAALTARDFQFLTLSSGYNSLQSRPDTQCGSSQGVNFTVDDCVALCSLNGTCNADFTLENAGQFYYDSAHYETRASSLIMVDGPLTTLHRPALGS